MVSKYPQGRRVEFYRERSLNAWGRGFAVGFIVASVIFVAFVYGQREAYGATRPAPRAVETSTIPAGYPPHWRTWILVGKCEQPSRTGGGWHGIAWGQSYNYTYPGGMGFTRQNWETFRRPSQERVELMSDASPVEQLWAAERLWRWAERTYPGRGYTAWDCSPMIGWTSSDPTDAVR